MEYCRICTWIVLWISHPLVQGQMEFGNKVNGPHRGLIGPTVFFSAAVKSSNHIPHSLQQWVNFPQRNIPFSLHTTKFYKMESIWLNYKGEGLILLCVRMKGIIWSLENEIASIFFFSPYKNGIFLWWRCFMRPCWSQ